MAKDNFERARYSMRLQLPEGCESFLRDARAAIESEYRATNKPKKFVCRDVEAVAPESAKEKFPESAEIVNCAVYKLTMAHTVEFDWSWEGAKAFQTTSSESPARLGEVLAKESSELQAIEESVLWQGELLEVEETQSAVFVAIEDPRYPPSEGEFCIQPFDFLAEIYKIYNSPAFERVGPRLASRLNASLGGVHPAVASPSDVGLTELKTLWSKSWGVLWGPPGAGKTYTTGQQVASVLKDQTERILVVSTTNRATDAAALNIGRATKGSRTLVDGKIVRVGKGAHPNSYLQDNLAVMLRGADVEKLVEIENLVREAKQASTAEAKALASHKKKTALKGMQNNAKAMFLDADVRVVCATAYQALRMLTTDEVKSQMEKGEAPFTTIFIDEAGLISRACTAVLSLLASRRVILVGDPNQLSPISKQAPILSPDKAQWLASSGLSHLSGAKETPNGVYLLSEQYRMHPEICRMVSSYQYNGELTSADERVDKISTVPESLLGQPRAIWYVLDDPLNKTPKAGAKRKPGTKGWVRPAGLLVLDKLLKMEGLANAHGLFISPFLAQAVEVQDFLARRKITSWQASTVHSQQGAEAQIVVFDTVQASCQGWNYDEWQRLINVGLSRAQEVVIVMATRAELEQPFLVQLRKELKPQVVVKRGMKWQWVKVKPRRNEEELLGTTMRNQRRLKLSPLDSSTGAQILRLNRSRPVLSAQQERLINMKRIDGIRLVRGVAGSGKSLVLAHWVVRRALEVKKVKRTKEHKIQVVYANRALRRLLEENIADAWGKAGGEGDVWDHVACVHIIRILKGLLEDSALEWDRGDYDYNGVASDYLAKVSKEKVESRYSSMFIDEAQDMGPQTLELLTLLVSEQRHGSSRSRSVAIFYDNDQSLYERGEMPKWVDIGLDVVGRTTIMRDSFRSTVPIMELARNILCRLDSSVEDGEHKDLMRHNLLEKIVRGGETWWRVNYCAVDGPFPDLRIVNQDNELLPALVDCLRELICDQGVLPQDICIVGMKLRGKLNIVEMLSEEMKKWDCTCVFSTNDMRREANQVLLTTPHSFKGYEAEVVIIPNLSDFYVTDSGNILTKPLYVAMTRARSILKMFSVQSRESKKQNINTVVDNCCALQKKDSVVAS